MSSASTESNSSGVAGEVEQSWNEPAWEGRVEPDEIWQTIVKADEALKYATAEKADRRRQQAIERLQTALREAEVSDAEGRLLARASATFIVLPAPGAF